MNSFKNKLSDSLGAFGIILYYLVSVIVYILPFIMIGGGFWFSFILITINSLVPFATIVFWIWGLIAAIKGPQDIWAIAYYVAFAVIWLPFYISSITSLFKRN